MPKWCQAAENGFTKFADFFLPVAKPLPLVRCQFLCLLDLMEQKGRNEAGVDEQEENAGTNIIAGSSDIF